MIQGQIRLRPCGDSAVTIEFGDRIDERLNERVVALEDAVNEARLPGIIECVPTYRSLLVHIDPLLAKHDSLLAELRRLAIEARPNLRNGQLWKVPVLYGGNHGVDLGRIASGHGMSEEKVVSIHSGSTYRVYMVGFMPGFTYLGGLDPRLATPRRRVPRNLIPGGSVAIGGAQAAITSNPSPSGWHLIGRTPVRCFDPDRASPFLFEVGDSVSFEPIGTDAWDQLRQRSAAGEIVATCSPH